MSMLPDVLRIESSSLCNFSCLHCPKDRNRLPNSKLLSKDLFHEILNSYLYTSEVPRVVVLYHGGEPLLNKQLEYFINYCKSIGVLKTVITTNASLLTQDRAESLCISGLDEIKISFDGSSPDENDAIRVGGSFQNNAYSVVELIKVKNRLQKQTPSIKISNVQILSHHELLSYSVDDFKKGPLYLTGNNYLHDYFHEYVEEISFQSIAAMYWPQVSNSINLSSFSVFNKHELYNVNYCKNLFETITVLSDGSVVPCCYDIVGSVVFGNVKNESIMDMWNSKKYQAFRNSFREMNYPILCKDCNHVRPVYLCLDD